FANVWTRAGLTFDFVDLTDPDAVLRARRPETKIVWLETPTNPLLKLAELVLLLIVVKESRGWLRSAPAGLR
ncbi:MAG: PLP-dependent transferase, partial [Phycisphaeraceae bacterium]|nr:PLP-dependent transferase [Phycisphaeraceae bacterium]